MARRAWERVLQTITLTTTVLLLAAGPASGAVVRLTFDPSFGTPYPYLGFAGAATLQVDNGCLTTLGTVTPDSGSCGAITIQSATVSLFDLHADPGMTGAPAQTLDFSSDLVASLVSDIVVGFDQTSETNVVTGLDTSIFGPQSANLISAVPFPGGNVWLWFQSSPVTTVDPAYILIGNGESCDSTFASCTLSNPATVTFRFVPEPGSIALVVAAMAAVVVSRRRRRYLLHAS